MKHVGGAVAVAVLLGSTSVGQAAETKGAEALWHKACGKDGNGHEACIVEQFAVAMPQNVVAAHIRLSATGQPDQMLMRLTVPLGVLLARGLVLSVDDTKPIDLPFERCTREGCEATAVLDKRALATFTHGTTLTVRYAMTEAAPLDIPIRLQGLADALTQLSK